LSFIEDFNANKQLQDFLVLLILFLILISLFHIMSIFLLCESQIITKLSLEGDHLVHELEFIIH